MRRRVTGGRPRRGRAGSGGWLLFERSLPVVVAGDRLGERPGQKEKLKLGIKKAQNGIKIKSISTTTSAGSKKKISVLVNRN